MSDPKTDDELRMLLHESMAGAKKFHQQYGKKYGFSLKRITELSKQSHVAQVLAPAKPAIYQRIIAPDFSFQIDLTFWGPRDNPLAIMFVMIEMTSRKLWAEIVPNKKSDSCLPIFRKILTEVTGDAKHQHLDFGYISADDGGEWASLKKLCDQLHIPWRVYTGVNKGRKMGLVERANRQIKDRIRAFQEPTDDAPKAPNAWKPHLKRFISVYNDTLHSTINRTPNDAYTRMGEAREHIQEREPAWKDESFSIGDPVRIKIYKDHVFEKKVNTWSRDIYTVSNITDTGIEVEGGDRPYQRYELLKIPKGKAWKAPSKEAIVEHKAVDTAQQKALRVQAVQKELKWSAVESPMKEKPAIPAPVVKPKSYPSLVRKDYEVLNHRGDNDTFELEVKRKLRGKDVIEWFPLSSFIKSGGVDETAYEYIKRKKVVKRSGI